MNWLILICFKIYINIILGVKGLSILAISGLILNVFSTGLLLILKMLRFLINRNLNK